MQITDVATVYSTSNKNYPPVETGFDVGWHSNHVGFGRLLITVDEDGKVEIDTEHMDKDHFMEVMSALYDMAEVK